MASVGVGVSLAAPAAVSVKEVAAAAAAALRGQFAELFTGRSANSLAALFAFTDSHQLAAFSRALRSLHD